MNWIELVTIILILMIVYPDPKTGKSCLKEKGLVLKG